MILNHFITFYTIWGYTFQRTFTIIILCNTSYRILLTKHSVTVYSCCFVNLILSIMLESSGQLVVPVDEILQYFKLKTSQLTSLNL